MQKERQRSDLNADRATVNERQGKICNRSYLLDFEIKYMHTCIKSKAIPDKYERNQSNAWSEYMELLVRLDVFL